jgi:chromosomal replication initiator protein
MRPTQGEAISSALAEHRPRVVTEAELRDALAQRLGPDRFGIWFGSETRLSLEGELLCVVVPSAFFRDWIQSHFAGALTETASALAKHPVTLEMKVASATEPGPAGVLVVAEPNVNSRPQRTRTLNRTTSESEAPPVLRRTVRRLDDFVTGAGNKLAHAAAVEMVQSLGNAFNPLFVHGGIGLGKSHLLEAIGGAFLARRRGWNLVQVTAESFTNRFLEAMRSGTLNAFRARFRNADALLIDDVHFLAAKRATQLEFLHTFNALHAAGRPIVLSADQHPVAISKLSEELATRFVSGMVVKIEPADFALRRAIVRAKAAARGIELPSEVTDYVAEHIRSSVRELEGALQSLLATATLLGSRIDMALARQTLRDLVSQPRQTLTLLEIERVVERHFQLEPGCLGTASRQRTIANARALAMFLARRHLATAYGDIGRHFGGRNHSTVIAAEKRVREHLERNAHLRTNEGQVRITEVLANLERALGV